MGMSGYTKLFNSILASTIWRSPDKTRIVWITLLALSDKDGICEGSIPGLADLARVSIEDCETALVELAAPDRYSRSPEHQGRRIEAIPGTGWRLLNHAKYRAKMSEADRREYNRRKQAEWRERNKKTSNNVIDCQSQSAMSAHTEADTDTKAVKEKSKALSASADVVAVFDHWKIAHKHPLARLGLNTTKRYRAIAGRLKDGYSVSQLKTAVDGCRNSPHHMGENDRHEIYDDIELICRDAAHVDKFIRFASVKTNGLSPSGRAAVSAGEAWLANQEAQDAAK